MKILKKYQFIALPVCLLTVIYMILFYLSYEKLGNILVDSFRDAWVGLKLSHGSILYKDVRYLMGPVMPYILSLFFKFFGIHIKWIYLIGFICSLIGIGFMYKISRLFYNSTIAFNSILVFIVTCIFGSYTIYSIFNWIYPYNLASVIFCVEMMGCAYFTVRYILTLSHRYLLFSSFLMFAGFLTRPLMTIESWFIWLCFLGGWGILNRKKQIWFYVFGVIFISLGLYCLLIDLTNCFEGIKESLWNLLIYIVKGKFIFSLHTSGTDFLYKNILLSFKVFFVETICFCLLAGITSLFRLKQIPKFFLGRILTFIFVIFIAFCFSKIIFYFFENIDFFRSLPVIILYYLLLKFKNYKNSKTYAFLFILAFSGVLLHRIIFKVVLGGYSFYLIPLGIPVFIGFFYKTGIRLFKEFKIKYRIDLNHYKIFFSLAMIFCTYYLSVDYLYFYQMKTKKIEYPRGTLICLDTPENQILKDTIDFLRKETESNETFVVFPEGIGINYLSERDNPLRYESFLPFEIDMFGEKKLIWLIQKYSVDRIIIAGRRTDIYGAAYFGYDYAQSLKKWIEEHYFIEKVFGEMPFISGHFGIAVYKRK